MSETIKKLKKVILFYNPNSGSGMFKSNLDSIIERYQKEGYLVVPIRAAHGHAINDYLAELDKDTSVSYTHLDVYKRKVLYTKTRKAGKTDRLEDSTHYGEVSLFMTDFLQQNTYKLIEAAAENLAEAVLDAYPLVEGIDLELKKPWAPVKLPLDYVSVKISRFWHTAYIAMGSNLGDKMCIRDRQNTC